MKNLILIVSLVFLTACGKDVGKNNPTGNPPVSNPADWGSPNGTIESDLGWNFSDPNLGSLCDGSQGFSTKQTVLFDGKIEVTDFISTRSDQQDFYLVNSTKNKYCRFMYDGQDTHGRDIFVPQTGSCAFQVSAGDKLEIQYVSACNNLQAIGSYWED